MENYTVLQRKFLAKKNPFHVRILFSSFNHDINHDIDRESAERGLPR